MTPEEALAREAAASARSLRCWRRRSSARGTDMARLGSVLARNVPPPPRLSSRRAARSVGAAQPLHVSHTFLKGVTSSSISPDSRCVLASSSGKGSARGASLPEPSHRACIPHVQRQGHAGSAPERVGSMRWKPCLHPAGAGAQRKAECMPRACLCEHVCTACKEQGQMC